MRYVFFLLNLLLPPMPSMAQVVVELFTSQGCHSCPIADRMISKLVDENNPDILPLSYHVDYWDYIGWKDEFAKPEHTRYQRQYARTLFLPYVFTPQIIVNGEQSMSGTNPPGVLSYLSNAQSPQIPLRQQDGYIFLPKTLLTRPLELWLISFDHRHESKITRGENSGKTLKYSHVVRERKRLDTWRGGKDRISIPSKATYGQALIIQEPNTGKILGSIVLR